MTINPSTPEGGGNASWLMLVSVVALAMATMQSEPWTNALGTAAAICSVLANGDPNRRN